MLFKFKLVRLILGDILLISAFVLLLNTQAQAQNKGQIVFSGSGGAIFVMDAKGENVRQLTGALSSRSLDWSPGGSKIVFYRFAEVYNIYVVDANGQNLHALTDFQVAPLLPFHKPPMNPPGAIDPAWSPDGDRIAFTLLSGPENVGFEIYVMDTNGENERLLTTSPHNDHHPSWSPDGEQIAFSSSRNKNRDIYIMDSNGNNVHRLTNHPDLDEDPAWSPDGTKIAFISYTKQHREGDIYVIDVDGQNRRNLTHDPAHDRDPAWSPDGTKIAFYSYKRDNDSGIYVMDADGKNIHKLINGGHPAWFDPAFARPVSPKGKFTVTWGWIKQGTK